MWIETITSTPPEGLIVNTKIEDDNGVRNEQELIYSNNLWWHTDKKMYVYYSPTHWKL